MSEQMTLTQKDNEDADKYAERMGHKGLTAEFAAIAFLAGILHERERIQGLVNLAIRKIEMKDYAAAIEALEKLK